MPDLWPFIGSILTAIAAIVTGAFLLRGQRRKLSAEADSLAVSAASQVITSLQTELRRLCERVEELEADYQQLRIEYESLGARLAEAREENRKLLMENGRWKERVRVLEHDLSNLRQRMEVAGK